MLTVQRKFYYALRSCIRYHRPKGDKEVNKNTFFRTASGVTVVFLLCCIAFAPRHVVADLLWSEPFENLDGWTAIERCYIDDNDCLRATTDIGRVYRESTLTSGTWMLDVVEKGEWEPTGRFPREEVRISFMSTHYTVVPWEYYQARIARISTSSGYKYVYYLDKKLDVDEGGIVTLDSYEGIEGTDLTGTVHHLAITRTEAGQMKVFLNGTPILEATNNEFTTPEYFSIEIEFDYAVDNVTVYDSIEIGGIPMELLAVGGGAVAIVAITLVVLKRRR